LFIMSGYEATAGDQRANFMRTDGFLLYTDVQERVLAELENQPFEPVPTEVSSFSFDTAVTHDNPAGASLYVVMDQLKNQVCAHMPYAREPDSTERYGITKEDIVTSQPFTFENGLEGLTFPWHFSAGVANAVVETFDRESKLSSEARENLTLTDWADIIDRPWYGQLIRSLAFTRNGVHGDFGKQPRDYRPWSFQRRLLDMTPYWQREKLKPVFDTAEETDPQNGATYMKASLSEGARTTLRRLMREPMSGLSSAGCPVARLAVTMSTEAVETNPHAQQLLSDGLLHVERADGEKVTLRQEDTAIDRTLAFFATQLRAYDQQYGTPHLGAIRRDGSRRMVQVRHEVLAATDPLRVKAAKSIDELPSLI
jgi:hypothetical protein